MSASRSGRASRLPNPPPSAIIAKKPMRPIASEALGVGETAATSTPRPYIANDVRARTARVTGTSPGSSRSKASTATPTASPTPTMVWATLTSTCATSTIIGCAGVAESRRRIPYLR